MCQIEGLPALTTVLPTIHQERGCKIRALLFTLVLGLSVALAPQAYAITVYVSNEKDNTISVIDGDTHKVIATVPVGQRPRGIILSHDKSELYICASDSEHIEVLDLKTLKVTKTLPSGPDPELFILHPTGNPLYIANEDDNMITITDVEKGNLIDEVPVGVEPEGMGISPDGSVLVNTSETTNMAHFIDTKTYEVFDNVLVDTRPRVAIFTRDGAQVWVSSEIGGTISVIDAKSRQVIKKIGFEISGIRSEAIQPVGIRLTSDGKIAFVALQTAWRSSMPRRSKSRNTYWSANASGNSPSARTKASCSLPTASATTCR